METGINRKDFWNEAGKAGLILGAISSIYMFLTQLLTTAGVTGFLSTLLTFVLWGAKFAGCIWILMLLMKRFCQTNPSAGNSDTFRFGMLAALLSAFVYSSVSFANVAYISADLYAEQMDTMMQAYAQFMDSNMMAEMEKWTGRMPQLTFVSNMIYCTIYGIILSFILSRNIPSRDPFADYKPDEQ